LSVLDTWDTRRLDIDRNPEMREGSRLDLNALDPFLTKLDEEEANELRREVARKSSGVR
jgi:hypothetical protein